jgi:CheY-like chemotaxis protein
LLEVILMAHDLLLVDDSAAALMMYTKIVEICHVPVGRLLTARNGRDALAKLEAGPVDFILTDIHMPEMDGFELIAALKQDPRLAAIPVAVVTSEGRGPLVEKALALGASFYLKKPFPPEEFRRVLLQALGEEDHEPVDDDSGSGDF